LRLEGVSVAEAKAKSEIFITKLDEYVNNNQGVFVYFAFEENNYLTFASWLEQTLNYIKEQNAIIAYYETIAKQRSQHDTEKETQND